MEFKDYEVKELRSKVADIPIGKVFRRTYKIPPEFAGTIPVYEDLMPGYVSVNPLYDPYVTNVQFSQDKQGSDIMYVLTFMQGVAP